MILRFIHFVTSISNSFYLLMSIHLHMYQILVLLNLGQLRYFLISDIVNKVNVNIHTHVFDQGPTSFLSSLRYSITFLHSSKCRKKCTDFSSPWCQTKAPWVLSRYIHVPLFATQRTEPTNLSCPRESPGKISRKGCCALLPGIFPRQELSHSFVSCIGRWVLYY